MTGAGHQVTRFLTHDTPTAADLANLNTFDLVIVGRSVASGHYQQADEATFWNNSLTKPLIHMGGFAIRGGTGGGSRLGLYAGETIPDAAGPIRLTVNNPSHPIFAGIALDGTNTTVNPYANVVSLPHAPNTLQRGISVVTGALAAGGQVLATVGTVGDPAVGGTVIAKFSPGASLASNPATTLAGHRLIFLSGSREAANQMIPAPGPTGTNAETSGIYDLTQDGGRMFLNAVNFMAAIPEPSTVALLIVALAGLGLIRKR